MGYYIHNCLRDVITYSYTEYLVPYKTMECNYSSKFNDYLAKVKALINDYI